MSPICLPAGQQAQLRAGEIPHTWLPSPYHYYSEERSVPSNQKYTQLNRASPANDNHREWHTFPSWAIRIKPGGSGPSITCARILLLLNTRSWFQHLRATMRLISQSSWCVIRRCCTICHTRIEDKTQLPTSAFKELGYKRHYCFGEEANQDFICV